MWTREWQQYLFYLINVSNFVLAVWARALSIENKTWILNMELEQITRRSTLYRDSIPSENISSSFGTWQKIYCNLSNDTRCFTSHSLTSHSIDYSKRKTINSKSTTHCILLHWYRLLLNTKWWQTFSVSLSFYKVVDIGDNSLLRNSISTLQELNIEWTMNIQSSFHLFTFIFAVDGCCVLALCVQ